MAFFQFKREQFIKSSIGEVWDFISTPQNLKRITPSYMGFDIRTPDLPHAAYEGMIIAYTVRPLLGNSYHLGYGNNACSAPKIFCR